MSAVCRSDASCYYSSVTLTHVCGWCGLQAAQLLHAAWASPNLLSFLQLLAPLLHSTQAPFAVHDGSSCACCPCACTGGVCCVIAAAGGRGVTQPAAAAGSGRAAEWWRRGSTLRAVWATRHRCAVTFHIFHMLDVTWMISTVRGASDRLSQLPAATACCSP
jgi:hypothetical protein